MRVGDLTINSEPVVGVKSTNGCLYITNQRFVFKEISNGLGGILNIKHTDIIDFRVAQDGIKLFRENGKSIIFIFGKEFLKGKEEYIVSFISRIIRDANN